MSHTFSVDGTPHPLDFFPTLLLLGDLRSLVSPFAIDDLHTHITCRGTHTHAHTHAYTHVCLPVVPCVLLPTLVHGDVCYHLAGTCNSTCVRQSELHQERYHRPHTLPVYLPCFAPPQYFAAVPIQVWGRMLCFITLPSTSIFTICSWLSWLSWELVGDIAAVVNASVWVVT